MDKDELKELARDPRFIPGIYNYCDRWCERCSFTSRCLLFAMNEEQFADPESRDINNEKFWRNLHATFQMTKEMLKEMAEEEGIDLDSPDTESAMEEQKKIRDEAESSLLSQEAKAYADMVDAWLSSSKTLFEEKDQSLNQQVQLSLSNTDPEVEVVTIKDAVEVIRWYQHQIYVKLMRALTWAREDESSTFQVTLMAQRKWH